jgi:Uma2 family endonuclease
MDALTQTKALTMIQPATIHRVSVEEYLAGEQTAEVKHEYVNGEVYAMVGVSDRHEIIALNLASALRSFLKGGPCQVFFGGVKVRIRIASDERFYYPDIMVACDPSDRDPYYRDRPRVLMEVLSPSTERIDRTEKGEAYRQIDSLQEYLLVTQDQRRVEVQRRENGWGSVVYERTGRVRLACLDLTLDLDAIYSDSGVSG